jgi:hypothetical protein
VSCEEWRELVSRELDRGVTDAERARISGHLIGCPECSQYREELHGVTVALDAVGLPLREEAAEIVEGLGDRRPGTETVPGPIPARVLWGLIGALVALAILAFIAAAAS